MLEKPKYLTGEVKEFINTTFVCVKSSGYGEAFDIDRWFNINEYELKPFYNQPFDPAMIEKYFKEWECVLNDTEFQTTQFSQYVNILIEEDLIINHTEKLFCIEDWELMIPQTLNHFISDCIRAGIKLEWRE